MDQPPLPEHLFSDRQHVRLLKLFTLAAAASILLILVLTGSGIFQIFRGYVVKDAEKDAIHIGNGLLLPLLQPFIEKGGDGSYSLAISEGHQEELDEKVLGRLAPFEVLKVKIYDPGHTILYSNDRQIIGHIDKKNKQLEAALGGEVVSRLERKTELWDLDQEHQYDLDMVESYLPLLAPNGSVIGSMELYMDVSLYRSEFVGILVSSLLILGAVLLLVFGTLLLFMHRASRIIYSKSEEIKVLSGLLPICSSCKKIRNDAQEWELLESYITEHSESVFTHSMCPECLKKYWPE